MGLALFLLNLLIGGTLSNNWSRTNTEIFYTYDSSMLEGVRGEVEECVQKAIEILEGHTCLFFSKFDFTTDRRSSSITFQLSNSTDECNFHSGGFISLGTNCGSHVTFVSLLNESFGWLYEHQRFDRDEFVSVNFTNVLTEHQEDFLLSAGSLRHEVPYDLSSVMHFHSHEFAFDTIYPTMIVKNPLMVPTISSQFRDHKNPLSFRDKRKLNAQFLCAEKCAPLNCSHQGYVDSSCRCVCPDGFSGERCEHLKRQGYYKVPGCGFLSHLNDTITSPSFPLRYPHAVFCEWIIMSPRLTDRVAFRIEHLDLEFETIKTSQDCLDTLKIFPHGTDVVTKALSCRPEDVVLFKSRWLLSQHNWLFIEFRSDPWGTFNHSGFRISYKILRINDFLSRRRGLSGISSRGTSPLTCYLGNKSLTLYFLLIFFCIRWL